MYAKGPMLNLTLVIKAEWQMASATCGACYFFGRGRYLALGSNANPFTYSFKIAALCWSFYAREKLYLFQSIECGSLSGVAHCHVPWAWIKIK